MIVKTPKAICIPAAFPIFLLFSRLTTTGAILDAAMKNLILSMHNELRVQVNQGELNGQPKASNLPKLVWDGELANLAETLVEACMIRHDDASLPNYGRLGQNIAANVNVKSVQSWIDENINYNHPSNTCNAVCEDHAQMVAKRSTKIGCAVKDCTGRWPYNYFIACSYALPGDAYISLEWLIILPPVQAVDLGTKIGSTVKVVVYDIPECVIYLC